MRSTLVTLSSSLLVLVSVSTSQSLPPGCSADNALRAVRAHTPNVASFCSSFIPKAAYTAVDSPGVLPYRTTGGYATVTKTYPYRYTEFTNVYRDNYQYVDPTRTATPLTYSDNKPSPWQVQPTAPIPTYLPYDFWRIYSACTCLYPPTTTITETNVYARSVVYVSPTGTYTQSDAGPSVSFFNSQYAAICNPSIFDFAQVYKTITANRPARTISPLPFARTRADCCQLCADTMNCLYWQHSKNGACKYVWATDVKPIGPYDKCPNGYDPNGLTFNTTGVSKEDADWAFPGTCGVGNGFDGEDQSSQDSTEIEFMFKDNCKVYGGSYC